MNANEIVIGKVYTVRDNKGKPVKVEVVSMRLNPAHEDGLWAAFTSFECKVWNNRLNRFPQFGTKSFQPSQFIREVV